MPNDGMQRLNGRILAVQTDTDGSTAAADAAVSDTVLYVNDASDFHEGGGQLKLDDGKLITYSSADMDADSISLVAPLAIEVLEGAFVSTFPVVKTRWASCEIFGYDDPLNVLVPLHYWAWLRGGAREESKQERVTVIYDGNDWIVFNVEGVAASNLSSDNASSERIFRYTSEGLGADGYLGVKLVEDSGGTITACRVMSETAVTVAADFDLLLNETSISTMTIPAGSKFSPLYSLTVAFGVGDQLRVEHTAPADSTPNLVVWVYANLDNGG